MIHIPSAPLSRRTMLRGLGVSMAVPFLDAMGSNSPVAAVPSEIPKRLGFAYIPNGVIMDHWRPKEEGTLGELPASLKPLDLVKTQIQVLSGLDHDKANNNGDGGGDHARANATFLTGIQARKTDGADISLGISVDQVAASQLAGKTRLDSLQVACDVTRKSGRCDSGYSCAYQYNFSWAGPTTPIAPEVNPRVVFEKLFGSGLTGDDARNREQRTRYQHSLLDYVREDAKRLQSNLGSRDKSKLDEYLTGVRELERQIENAERFAAQMPDETEMPSGIPQEFSEHVRMMYELMAIAFQTDTTRIATFLVAHDGSNRNFRDIGVSEGHHALSHHRNDQGKMDQLQKIDHFYVQQFAWFVQKLQSLEDVDGTTVLDNSMFAFGGGHADGNRHSHVDLPLILAGGGSGSLTRGRHHHYHGKPMTNLFLNLLDEMGVTGVPRLGDSTGRLSTI